MIVLFVNRSKNILTEKEKRKTNSRRIEKPTENSKANILVVLCIYCFSSLHTWEHRAYIVVWYYAVQYSEHIRTRLKVWHFHNNINKIIYVWNVYNVFLIHIQINIFLLSYFHHANNDKFYSVICLFCFLFSVYIVFFFYILVAIYAMWECFNTWEVVWLLGRMMRWHIWIAHTNTLYLLLLL